MGGVFISILSLFSFISGCSVHGTGIIDEPSSSKSYTITIANTEHGTVSSSIASATANTNVTLTVAPENGYKCTKISVTKDGGGEVDTTPDNSEPPKNYNFKMPESNVTVTATFTAVAPSDGGSGGGAGDGAGGGGGGAGTTGQALTIEAIESGTISVTNPWSTLKYTKNGGALTAYSEAITVAAGDKVCFFAESSGNTYISQMKISCTSDCYVYGNIMSLVTLEANATDSSKWNSKATSITTEYAFASLFYGNSHIKNHASEKLYLPATTLATNCYEGMFMGCTNLTSAPALPATTLVNMCYYCMFMNCSSLANAPKIMATTVASGSCNQMFSGCTSLTSAPDLLAETLENQCYLKMFSGCTNLNSIKCLATDISAPSCTKNWLFGVAASGTFTTASATTWQINNDSGIPSGWTRLNPDGSEWIAPAATVTTAPTATTGDITAGSNTALVTAGTASGGTMMYAVTTENTKPTSTEGFTATVPTAESRAAGTFYVWYYVKADSTHTDSEIAGSVTVTVNAAPAAGTTVTWDSTNVFVEANENVSVSRSPVSSATFEGITIAFNGGNNSRFNPYQDTLEGHAATLLVYGDHGDSFIFTAPTGKLFSKIEISSSNSSYVFTAYGDWTKDNDNNKIVWSGTPSSSVTLGGNVYTTFGSLESIVFTMVDAN